MTIGKIKLAPGNAGWYDALTNIHVTIANPVAEVKAGMNTHNIKKGLAYGTIILVQGSINEEEIIAQSEEQIHNEVIQTSTVEETVADDKAEEVTEAIEEAEEKPKKSSRKKAKTE